MIGKPGSSVLVTLAEPKTRYSVIAKAPDKSAQAVTDALLTALQPHADLLVHTLTYDNGKEFAYHQTVAEGLDAQGYFAHPYHSWERGLNENTNGLIRQYLQGHRFPDSHT
jgi:IS30 family transposase